MAKRSRGHPPEPRTASWLHSPYSADDWTISEPGTQVTARISFDYVMPDGTSLLSKPRLYSTVKEYAFWVRDSRYGSIGTVAFHATLVKHMIQMAHAIALHGLASFAEITPSLVETLADDAAYGVDGLIRVPARLRLYLTELSEAGRLENFRDRKTRRGLNVGDLLAGCGLDPWTARVSRSAAYLLRQIREVEGRLTFVDEAPKPLGRITGQNVHMYLVGLSSIYQMRARMSAETIRFEPFPDGPRSVADSKGTRPERTPVPSPKLVSALLGGSVRWVTEYAPPLVSAAIAIRAAPRSRRKAVRTAELQKLPSSEIRGGPWPIKEEGREAGLTLDRAMRLLVTACWVIIATFSAARASGISSIKGDCTAGDDDSGWWISIFIAKTLRREDWLPVPRIVVEAVDVLRSLTGGGPKTKESLFHLPSLGDGEGRKVHPQLDAFATLVGATSSENGGPWSLSPHQFRAFFATFYFWRYSDARIEVISHHLRHFSVETTRQYLTQDREGAQIWAEVEKEFVAGIAKGIVAGKHEIGGSIGEHYKKVARRAIAHFRKNLIVVEPDALASALVHRMTRKGLVFTPTAWGYICTCSRTRAAAAKAKCREANELGPEDVGPDLAYAGGTVCSGCPHAMSVGPVGEMINDEITHLKRVDDTRPRDGSIFGELERNRLVTLRRQFPDADDQDKGGQEVDN